MSDYTEWRIKCSGGCGKEMVTRSLTTLWSVTTCPECKGENE